MMRSWYEKPQSSSSQRLNARQRGHRRRDVVAQRLLDAARERREHEHRLEALLVHHREARVAVLVLGPQRLDLHERARVDALGDLTAEHQVHAAGDDDRVERRVRDEAEELAAREQQRVAALLHRPAPRAARNSLSRWRVHASSVS